jgi:transcriptional regulator with XRE-family HTH domain
VKTLAELVRQYRSDARLSQEDLAERAGLSPRTISNIETGIAASPRATTLSLLVEALGLDAEKRERLVASIRRQTAGTRNPRQDGDSSPAFRRLPPAPTPFIGREAEVAACSDLLRHTDIRLVTLIGGAGVGKTSLALAVAHAIENDFDGGVPFVELAGVPEHAFVATKILFEAGAREVEGEELAETIASSLGKRRTLLALDTFEQVTGAAPFVRICSPPRPRSKYS